MRKYFQLCLDDCAESPREWDNLGTMACWHRRHKLGDIQPDEEPDQYLLDAKAEIALPLFLLDHSGLAMRTYNFDDCDSGRWDSGQVGWIYVTKEIIERAFGWKRLTGNRKIKIQEILKQEVEAYSRYLEGDIWGCIILDENGEELDSRWGFYGEDPETNGMKEQIENFDQLERITFDQIIDFMIRRATQ